MYESEADMTFYTMLNQVSYQYSPNAMVNSLIHWVLVMPETKLNWTAVFIRCLLFILVILFDVSTYRITNFIVMDIHPYCSTFNCFVYFQALQRASQVIGEIREIHLW